MYVLYMIRDTIHYTVQVTFIPGTRLVQKLRQNSHNFFKFWGYKIISLMQKGASMYYPAIPRRAWADICWNQVSKALPSSLPTPHSGKRAVSSWDTWYHTLHSKYAQCPWRYRNKDNIAIIVGFM